MCLSFPDLKLKPDNLLSSNITENIPAYLLTRRINRNKARQPQQEFEFGRSETKPSPCTVCNCCCSWCSDTLLQGQARSLRWKKIYHLRWRRHRDKDSTTLFKMPALKSGDGIWPAPGHNWYFVLKSVASYLKKTELLHNPPLKTEIVAFLQFSLQKSNATPYKILTDFCIHFIFASGESLQLMVAQPPVEVEKRNSRHCFFPPHA